MGKSFSKYIVFFFLIFFALIAKTSAQTDQTSAAIVYKYFGNSDSNKFHRPSCIFAQAINKRHLVLFQWRWQAIAAHYQPCRYCLPPVVKSTHAVLLPAR